MSKPESRLSKAGTQLFLFAFAGLVSFTIVWASYDLRYSAAVDPGLAAKQEEEAIRAISIHSSSVSYGRLGHLSVEQELRRVAAIKALSQKFDAASVTEKAIAEAIPLVQLGRFSQLILFLNDHRLLPEGYLEGLAILREASLSTPSYLRGEYSNAGFRSYFLWTFLLKTPLPAIVAIVAGIALAFYRKMSWARDFAFLLLPVAIGVLSLIPAHINIGHRHLLFVYPFLYVFAGGIARELPQKARGTWTLAGVITVLAASSSFVFYPLWRPQVIFPHFLAYFNELAGGPLNGWRSLADSNIDWGQDLPGLKAWLDRNNIREPVYLSYFGTADPRFYQIIHKPVPTVLGGYDFTAPPNENPYEATNLFQRALQPGDYIAISAHNVIGVRLSPGARDVWQQIFNRSTLVDRIGYSIFIYRVNG